MDEARFGLIPSYRALWARIGQRPIASSRRRYQWVYIYSFVHPASGELLNVVGQTVSAPIMSAVLAHFAEQTRAGPNRQIVLVLDGAGWHTAKSLVIPEGIHLVFLPPYSPELQPAERLFPLLNEVIANREFDDIDHLKHILIERLRVLDQCPHFVSANTLFHWWPKDISLGAHREPS